MMVRVAPLAAPRLRPRQTLMVIPLWRPLSYQAKIAMSPPGPSLPLAGSRCMSAHRGRPEVCSRLSLRRLVTQSGHKRLFDLAVGNDELSHPMLPSEYAQ